MLETTEISIVYVMSVPQQEAQMTTITGHFESKAMCQIEYRFSTQSNYYNFVNGFYIHRCNSYTARETLIKEK